MPEVPVAITLVQPVTTFVSSSTPSTQTVSYGSNVMAGSTLVAITFGSSDAPTDGLNTWVKLSPTVISGGGITVTVYAALGAAAGPTTETFNSVSTIFGVILYELSGGGYDVGEIGSFSSPVTNPVGTGSLAPTPGFTKDFVINVAVGNGTSGTFNPPVFATGSGFTLDFSEPSIGVISAWFVEHISLTSDAAFNPSVNVTAGGGSPDPNGVLLAVYFAQVNAFVTPNGVTMASAEHSPVVAADANVATAGVAIVAAEHSPIITADANVATAGVSMTSDTGPAFAHTGQQGFARRWVSR